jgi:hypothetical protein
VEGLGGGGDGGSVGDFSSWGFVLFFFFFLVPAGVIDGWVTYESWVFYDLRPTKRIVEGVFFSLHTIAMAL